MANSAIQEVGQNASREVLAGGRIPAHLLSSVHSKNPIAALAAIEVAEDLNAEILPCRQLDVGVMVRAALAHKHWWVRQGAAKRLSLLRNRVRVLAQLLNDRSLVVVAVAAEGLLTIPEASALRIIRSLDDRRRSVVSLILHASWCPTDHSGATRLLKALGSLTTESAEPASDMHAMKTEQLCLYLITRNTRSNPVALEQLLIRDRDPIARLCILEYGMTDEHDYLNLLRSGLTDIDWGVLLKATRTAKFWVGSDNFDTIGQVLLDLTLHPCVTIAQAAARSLREYLDQDDPPADVVDRLLSLVDGTDILTTLNVLNALQDGRAVAERIAQRLSTKFEATTNPELKVAIAETLWWLLPFPEWVQSYGSALFYLNRCGRHRFRCLVLHSALWDAPSLEEALERQNTNQMRRILRLALARSPS